MPHVWIESVFSAQERVPFWSKRLKLNRIKYTPQLTYGKTQPVSRKPSNSFGIFLKAFKRVNCSHASETESPISAHSVSSCVSSQNCSRPGVDRNAQRSTFAWISAQCFFMVKLHFWRSRGRPNSTDFIDYIGSVPARKPPLPDFACLSQDKARIVYPRPS